MQARQQAVARTPDARLVMRKPGEEAETLAGTEAQPTHLLPAEQLKNEGHALLDLCWYNNGSPSKET